MKHTPGPWKYCDKGIISNKIQSYGGYVVLEMPRQDEFTKEDEANARLIAEAPALVVACQKADRWIEDAFKMMRTQGHGWPDAADSLRIAQRNLREAVAAVEGIPEGGANAR
jgi:hypothetical protein